MSFFTMFFYFFDVIYSFFISRKGVFKSFFLGVIIVTFVFFFIKYFSGIFGSKYENDTKLYLRAVFASSHSSDPDFLASIREVKKDTGFELIQINVNSIWNGVYHLNGKKIPTNIYEIKTKWKNDKKMQ